MSPASAAKASARPDGEQSWFSVFCPPRSGAVALSECLNCGDCEGVGVHPLHESVVLRCRWSEAEGPLETTGASLPEADCISVTAIMSKDTICVDPELSLKALLQVLLERGISGAPVVDATAGLGLTRFSGPITAFSLVVLVSSTVGLLVVLRRGRTRVSLDSGHGSTCSRGRAHRRGRPCRSVYRAPAGPARSARTPGRA